MSASFSKSSPTTLPPKVSIVSPWPLNYLPQALQPYAELMRLHRPSGIILVFWPYAFTTTLAAYTVALPIQEYWAILGRFLLVSAIVRGAACTSNDILDRDVDAGVERTKTRPLPSGRVSVISACLFVLLQAAVSWYSFLPLNPLASIFYPIMKRVTDFPQAYLGFSMGFGSYVAWTAITGTSSMKVIVPMIFAFVCWTLHFDTIYACQDRKDDIKVGVRSAAVLLGDSVLLFTSLCASLLVVLLAYVGIVNQQSIRFFGISVAGSALHLIWQYATLDVHDGKSCMLNFTRNGQMGWIIWGGMLLDYFVKLGVITF
ncbi:UbiA prenyltransferase [Stereum hirsutum FP-91666 SS1]|uniref:UbiA prenyltransferase n=1 Tax=Stereum hirsutum (strain FP-91666) TaxID=721885 RepID=UPI000444A000|nr:UbiA prenyltransferase [Stereum hirsutum FP-91666 SS1]EIM84130.1 UbiA prenyltransferase [Stereum hirsutum FP-91666 SS1]